MSTASIMKLMETYSTATEGKVVKTVNPDRVEVGNVFLQPTGAKKGILNYSYCYWGFRSPNGFIGGFSLPNSKVLEMVQVGIFSKETGDNVTKAFTQYAEKFAKDHVVLK